MVQAAPPARAVGHQACGQPDRPPERARQDVVATLPPLDYVLVVAREHDGHELRGELRHHVGRDGGGVAERLVEIPGEIIHDAEDVRRDDHLVMLGAVPFRDPAGVAQLVEVLLDEADRERLHRGRGETRQRGHDRARVDAAAQERPQRHVAHHMQADRLLQALAQALGDLLLAAHTRGSEAHVPVPLDPDRPARGRDQEVAGLELAHALDDAVARRGAEAGEQVTQGSPAQAPFHA